MRGIAVLPFDGMRPYDDCCTDAIRFAVNPAEHRQRDTMALTGSEHRGWPDGHTSS
ncbi:hypothetical protein LMG29542_05975 [Paraburkholderia humisilvae]|uniref:Uncharacterized protein n=1 Tax=Paraburkholderia humisilvae TaxID=627669 RepID=A0A6J5EUK3_9BURK|nr:hypothetical protein LMG29542_05975 [Paraburkholderia humisilvae]